MDYDIVSNCSGLSNTSEEIRSNASTLSGLSTYQNEFAELRHLVNPLKYPSPTFERCSTPKQDSGCDFPYDDRFSNLSYQLENSLKLNERYKRDLHNLEKNIELKFYDKIDKLLKSNYSLKSELDNANSQIGRLIRNFSIKSNSSSISEQKYIQLEQQYHELSLQNSTLEFKLLENKNQIEEYELQNKQLKIELNELSIDFQAKIVCVKELKEKISQQHLEIETLLKSNMISNQSLSEVSNELERVKKMQEWYKELLHTCREDKYALSKEISKYIDNLSSQNETIETLNLELSKCKNKCDLIEFEALKEKEKFWKQLEKNNFLKLSQNQTELNPVQNDVNSIEMNDKSVTNYYEASIQDLSNEIIKIKEYVQEQDNTINKIIKENSELVARCVVLQKMIQQNETTIEALENSKKCLNMELELANNNIKEKSEELTSHKREILNLNSELNVRNEERELIESTIKTVRQQFFAFKSKYKKIEEELLQKNKQILQLETEKQKLFMDNNWNICELEKSKEKDAVINNLKVIISNFEKKNVEHFTEIKKLADELQEKEDIIKSLGEEKQVIINNSSLEIKKYEDVFIQYKVMVTNYEKEINTFQKLLSKSEINTTDLKDNISLLKEELSRRDSDLSAVTAKCTSLENKLMNSVRDSKIKPSDSNGDSEYYIKKLISNHNFNLAEILHHFMNVCKIDKGNKNDESKLKEIEDFSAMLRTIEEYLQNLDNKLIVNKQNQENNNILRIIIDKFRNEVDTELTKLDNKSKVLYGKIEKCCKMLNSFSSAKAAASDNEKVRELSVLLQVKEREIKDKQRKHEINNRTLLRKVKEHMKGRNTAEKHNKYLQELYNSLSDENNSLKLAANSKDYEIENIKKQLESYININTKLNRTVLCLEEKVVKSKVCDKCLDYSAATEKIQMLEKCVAELENGKAYIQNILKCKEDIILNLHHQNNEMLVKNSNTVSEKDKYKNMLDDMQREKENLVIRISSLESELKENLELVEELRQIIKEEHKKNLECNNQNSELKINIDQLNDKLEYLSMETEILNSTLRSKSEDLNQLEDAKTKMDSNWSTKEENSQRTITALKNYLHEMQVEMNSVYSEKYFLQRLCNDLKLALRTYVGHNKVLKEQLNILAKEKQEFNSLPNMSLDLPTSSKYDDTYINQLLQQNRACTEDKPLTEIKGCLDNLRKEVSILQDEIVKKNIGR